MQAFEIWEIHFGTIENVMYVIFQQTLVVWDRKCFRKLIFMKIIFWATGGANFAQIQQNLRFGLQIGSTGRQKNNFHKISKFDVFLTST